VTALYVPSSQTGMVTASADGKIQLWSAQLEVGSMFDVSALGCIDKSISALSWDPDNKKILVGMWSSEIYEINDAEGYNLHSGPVVSGHYSGKVCGIACNPTNPAEYCTVGGDKTVRIFDAIQKKVVKMVVLDTMAMCVAYSPDGSQIAVGFGGGGKPFKQKKVSPNLPPPYLSGYSLPPLTPPCLHRMEAS
jgi:microtubule-associated protein-like 6